MSEPPVVRTTSREPPVVAPARHQPDRTASALQAGKPAAAQVGSPGNLSEWIDKPWVVLLTLFGVTAVLGLPLLWKSRGFTRSEKWFWSVVVSLYTVLIFWIFGKIMWWSYSNIRDSLAL